MVNNLFAIEKIYGFSFENSAQKAGHIVKKTTKEDKKSGYSFFVEEEDIDENEDEIGQDFNLFYEFQSNFSFQKFIKKVQFSLQKKIAYFSFYHTPLFIVFRNIRL